MKRNSWILEDEDLVTGQLPDDEETRVLEVNTDQPEQTEVETDSQGNALLVDAEVSADLEDQLTNSTPDEVMSNMDTTEIVEVEAEVEEDVLTESTSFFMEDEEVEEDEMTAGEIEAAVSGASDPEEAAEAIEELEDDAAEVEEEEVELTESSYLF